ncbi:MAG: helix-turn-helix transcriptional regulator [Blautia sp.]|nr:helix-turn-helix transcriptional regulator [Blautia sp.]
MLDLYKRITEQTKKLGITGKELGDMLGLKKSPLTDWKNEKSNPTLDQLTKMCEIFAVPADYLLFGQLDYLSEDQTELINTYSKLDRRGRHRVHTIIYEELDRMEAEKIPSKSIV